MNRDRLSEIAVDLDDAWTAARTVSAPSIREPSLTLDDAYAIQELIVERRMASVACRRCGGRDPFGKTLWERELRGATDWPILACGGGQCPDGGNG